VAYGGAATLAWSASNATGCTASDGWTGTRSTLGSESTGALTATRSYTLTCTGAGGSASQSVTVNVNPPPAPTVTLSAAPSTVAYNAAASLNWSATNADACTASGGWGGARATSGTASTGSLTVSTVFRLDCTGPGGSATQSVTVTVTPPPAPTLSLSANPTSVAPGGAALLSWTSANATACSASGGWTGAQPTGGSASTGPLSTTTSYTLACTGPGGTVSQTATVTVVTPAPTLNFTASPATLAAGGTSTLNWSTSDATTCSASGAWSGSKATSGSQTVGPLSATASYILSCSGTGGSVARTTTVTVTAAPSGASFPLRVATDQRHLEDSAGKPFLVVGDTPWSLITAITKAEAETYLEDRRQRGFNAIIVNIIEHFYNGPATRDGHLPFAKSGSTFDFSRPNDLYFQHVDYVLNLARTKGMLVLLTPAYLGFDGGAEGWWPEINTALNTEAVMEAYGRYLGTRYRSFDNILWVMGGDWYGAESLAKTRAIVRGLQATDQPRLFTAHNARQSSALDTYSAEAWLSVNTTYSECLQTPTRLQADYNRARVMPFVYFEGRYENESDATPRCLRSQAYWPVLMGGVGSFFGNNPIWLFNPGWPAALDSTGARGMSLYGRLFASRNWSTLVPDYAATVLTGGRGALGADYAAAALTSDGATAIVYTPTQRALTIDMSKIAGGTARAWWFDPATGLATLIGDFTASGTRSFTPPTAQDWVLVIDNATLNLPAPGS
jgi:hypothetical protein